MAAATSGSQFDVNKLIEELSSPERSLVLSVTGDANQSQQSVTKEQKTEQSFLEKRRNFRIIYDKLDLTPDDIIDPAFAVMDESAGQAAFETKSRAKDELAAVSTSKSSKLVATESVNIKVFATTINLDDIHIDHTLNTEEGLPDNEIDLNPAPSAFYLPKMYPLTSYPKEINVLLIETELVFLYDLQISSFEKGTPEAAQVEEENAYYEYMTVGKGKNRKMVGEETQTHGVLSQTRHTLATRPRKKNASAFASLWDMYDTYAALAMEREAPEEDEMVLYQSAAQHLLRKKRRKGALWTSRRNKNFEEVGKMPEFLDAALKVDRVLASLEFDKAQKKFRGLVPMNPLALDLIYIYSMKQLWVFECDETATAKPILRVSFNPKNENILASAHGKFGYADNSKGMVCIWCTKNPLKPERVYHFECPVTSVSFSDKNPNWLACGFFNGDVIILDITSYQVKTMATSKRDTNPCFEPIWVTNWHSLDKDLEYLVTACEDGRIIRFTSTKTHEFICTPMMRVCAVEGQLKGLETPKACLKVDVPITRYPGVLCLIWHHSISHIYLVGTNEGCIHRCSTHYLNQHIDVFRAHAGPVYDISTSPFHPHLFASSGADGAVRLWIESMDEVFLTLMGPGAVHGVAFCPVNSTIILSISSNVCSVWDLRRKTHMPCAEYTFSPGCVLTHIQFSSSGDNVFIADTQGKIHTFHLEDTPIPPYYQTILLEETLRKALCTRPHLLKKYEKLEKLWKKQTTR